MELQDPDCLPCAATFHIECEDLRINDDDVVECCCSGGTSTHHATAESNGERPYKDNEDVIDPKSTGRKRAAQLYPIEPGQACEWSGLKFAGGGLYPIIGCVALPATHRHHGPDKNTLNNSYGNVHRICHFCHNRWHSLNDPVYDSRFGSIDWKKHDPETKATVEEQLANEARWVTNPADRSKED